MGGDIETESDRENAEATERVTHREPMRERNRAGGSAEWRELLCVRTIERVREREPVVQAKMEGLRLSCRGSATEASRERRSLGGDVSGGEREGGRD